MCAPTTTMIHWHIVPEGIPTVKKNCPKCGGGSVFENSGKFRVNANGRALDIWMIYRCRSCKSTWNMTLYERISPEAISKEELEGFMANDSALAMTLSYEKALYQKNDVQPDHSDITYSITKDALEGALDDYQECQVTSPCFLPVPMDKVIATCTGLSRSAVRKGWEQGLIQMDGIKRLSRVRLGKGQNFRCHRDLLQICSVSQKSDEPMR